LNFFVRSYNILRQLAQETGGRDGCAAGWERGGRLGDTAGDTAGERECVLDWDTVALLDGRQLDERTRTAS
jgi:hypothetical protein